MGGILSNRREPSWPRPHSPAWPSCYQHRGQEEEQEVQLLYFPTQSYSREQSLCGHHWVPGKKQKRKGIMLEYEVWLRFKLKPPQVNLCFVVSGHTSWVNTENTVTSCPKGLTLTAIWHIVISLSWYIKTGHLSAKSGAWTVIITFLVFHKKTIKKGLQISTWTLWQHTQNVLHQ